MVVYRLGTTEFTNDLVFGLCIRRGEGEWIVAHTLPSEVLETLLDLDYPAWGEGIVEGLKKALPYALSLEAEERQMKEERDAALAAIDARREAFEAAEGAKMAIALRFIGEIGNLAEGTEVVINRSPDPTDHLPGLVRRIGETYQLLGQQPRNAGVVLLEGESLQIFARKLVDFW